LTLNALALNKRRALDSRTERESSLDSDIPFFTNGIRLESEDVENKNLAWRRDNERDLLTVHYRAMPLYHKYQEARGLILVPAPKQPTNE
jgi:hypothetical protein